MTRKLRANLLLCSAALVVLAWPAHILFAHHDDDKGCQVCATVCSPELNSDCGGVISTPDGAVPAPGPERAVRWRILCFSAFRGRAPPSV